MSLLFGSYRGTAVPLNTKSIAVPRYDPKSRGIYIEETISCTPIYMPLLFGSYRGTAVPLEVSRYRGTFLGDLKSRFRVCN